MASWLRVESCDSDPASDKPEHLVGLHGKYSTSRQVGRKCPYIHLCPATALFNFLKLSMMRLLCRS